jgi:hypothetical protein
LSIALQEDPIIRRGGTTIYPVPVYEAKAIEQIAFMGLSLFWKSAALSWRDERGAIPSIKLGARYQEELRRFLLGQCAFPVAACLILELSDLNNRMISVVGTPVSSKFSTHHLHWLDIRGIRFNLLLGQRMPERLKDLCAFRQGTKCILIANDQESSMASTYHDLLHALAKHVGQQST